MGVKKGVFYSFMILALTIPLMLLVIFYSRVSVVSSNTLATKVVGEEVHNFIDSVAQDFPRALFISGRSAAAAVASEVLLTNYLPNANETINETAFNGSINNVPSTFMKDNYFLNWSKRVELKGLKYGLNVSVSTIYFSVTQFDSFNLLFNASIIVNASSREYDINFSKKYSSTVLVPVDGIEDPFFYRETGFERRLFLQNSTDVLGKDAFARAIDYGLYVSSNDGPCFLERLEGKAEPSGKYVNPGHVVGLETVVNVKKFGEHPEKVFEDVSVLDRAYFNATKVAGCNVTEFNEDLEYGWIRLNETHAERYGLNLLIPC